MSLWWVEFWKEEDGNAGLSLPVVMPLKVLVFVLILEEGKFSGRPISLDPEMVDTLVSERWETDPTFPELPSHLFSSHSWQKVMADRWFFRRYLQTRSPGPGQSTRAFAHSQPVHDCRLLLLSDYLSIVLCFNRGRSRDFRLLTQIRRFASVCPARNIRISVGWIPSEFNSSDKGSREHGNVYDSSKSVVHNLGSSEKQTFPVSRTWFDCEPDISQGGSPAQSGEVATRHDLLPEILNGAAEEARNSSQAILDDDGVKGWEEIQSPHVDGSREAGPSASRLRRIRPVRLEVEEGSRHVSISDKEKVTADRVRVGHRTRTCSSTRFGVRLGDEVRNWQESGDSSGICPVNSSIGAACWRADLGGGQAHGVHQPLSSKNHRGWRDEEMLASTL